MLSVASNVAVDAAALAVDQRRPEFAVQLLEEGRDIIFWQFRRFQADLSDATVVAPELAQRFDRISREGALLACSDPDDLIAHQHEEMLSK